jgi:hypothetical protein
LTEDEIFSNEYLPVCYNFNNKHIIADCFASSAIGVSGIAAIAVADSLLAAVGEGEEAGFAAEDLLLFFSGEAMAAELRFFHTESYLK